MVWRRGRATAVYAGFTDALDYPTHRPVLLLRDLGFEVHVVAHGPRRREEREGVVVWHEPSKVHMLARVARLRSEVTFTEETAFLVLTMLFGRARWIRNPMRSRGAVRRVLQSLVIRGANAVTFTNPHGGTRWTVVADRFVDLPYPVDAEFWTAPDAAGDEWWASRGIEPPAGPVLTYVANLVPRKRQPELVAALAPVLAERPTARLVLAGRAIDPQVHERVLSAAREHGVEAQVVLTGWLPPEGVRQLFTASTLQIVHSAGETQCMVVFEALGQRVPSVLTDLPELTTAFPLLPSYRDERELATVVSKALDDPSELDAAVEAYQPMVWWADCDRHDQIFRDELSRLLGRPLSV